MVDNIKDENWWYPYDLRNTLKWLWPSAGGIIVLVGDLRVVLFDCPWENVSWWARQSGGGQHDALSVVCGALFFR